MADITSFDPQKAPNAIKGLMAATESLKKTADETHAFVQERFGCWGEDDTGAQFADQYVPGYNKFWEQTKELLDNLALGSENLKKVQGSFTEVDGRNAENLG